MLLVPAPAALHPLITSRVRSAACCALAEVLKQFPSSSSLLSCVLVTPGEDRAAEGCSVLPLLTTQHGPLLASPLGQPCLLPLLCNPKGRTTLFDPAAGAVASLLLQRFSHPSFSLSQSQYQGNGKLLGRGGACCELSWKGKGLPPAASPSEPGSWAGCPPLPGGLGS